MVYMSSFFKTWLKVIAFVLFISLTAVSDTNYLERFSFDEDGALEKWNEMVLNGEVDYVQLKDGEDGYVRAFSDEACSALYYNTRFKLKDNTFLKWKWKAAQFPDLSGAKTDKDRDDYAARVYVIFPFLGFTYSKFLEYVWATDMPVGTVIDSPFGKNVKIIVVKSGPKPDGEWSSESRNIYQDYLMAFGKEPTARVGAIAIMCDADSSKTVAESFFDSIEIVKIEEGI